MPVQLVGEKEAKKLVDYLKKCVDLTSSRAESVVRNVKNIPVEGGRFFHPTKNGGLLFVGLGGNRYIELGVFSNALAKKNLLVADDFIWRGFRDWGEVTGNWLKHYCLNSLSVRHFTRKEDLRERKFLREICSDRVILMDMQTQAADYAYSLFGVHDETFEAKCNQKVVRRQPLVVIPGVDKASANYMKSWGEFVGDHFLYRNGELICNVGFEKAGKLMLQRS